MTPLTLAVDWSGRRDDAGQRQAIWVAEARAGRLVGLSGGRTRHETIAYLRARVAHHPRAVVGLDFCFGLPAWFARQLGCRDGPDVWAVAADQGERWIDACQPPFWGRPGRPRPVVATGERAWRRTEVELSGPHRRLRPKSAFQIGGAGAVGCGSLRGMPGLTLLRDEGACVWPFDAPRWPLVVEVYPRAFTGSIVKSDAGARAALLDRLYPSLAPDFAELARSSEDAFDAAVTALEMSRVADWPARLPPADDLDRLEGRVVVPG